MKKKIISLIIIVSILTAFAVTLAGCNGTVTVNPVKNSEFITKVKSTIWDEGAFYYSDFSYNNDLSVSDFTSGTPFARYHELIFKIASNKFDGKEFFFVSFDITADRDVEAVLNIYYGGATDENKRSSVALSLVANETKNVQVNLSKNFTTYNGDSTPYFYLIFREEPRSGTEEFAEWSQRQYSIANLEFYAN